MDGFNPQYLARVGASRGDLTGYRNQTPGFDPRSGEGARRFGGRFNPPGSFPVLYLCSTRACSVSELRRQADRQNIELEDMLPRELWIVSVSLRRVLDLTHPDSLRVLGLAVEDLVRDDHGFTQSLGRFADEFGYQAIRSRSATGTDDVFAVMVDNLGGGELRVELRETWTTVTQLETGSLRLRSE